MNAQLRPLLIALAAASLVSFGALLWLAGDLFASSRPVGKQPSLLDILDDVRKGDLERQGRPTAAPPPPKRTAWKAPLDPSSACPARGDALSASLSDRLTTRLARLPRARVRIPIHPSNYGDRFRRDVFGNQVDPSPRLVVLHETVYGVRSAINTFRTPHPRDEDQVSYHVLIALDGTVIETLDPSKRAFGAGYSAFNGEWVVTNPEVGGSINNFALHLSLESPVDGEDQEATHSGYSEAQYDALSVVLADWMHRYRIRADHITTHRHVDLGGARADPRSFNWSALADRLAALGMIC